MLYAIVAVLVIILDQWVKYYVAANIALDTGAVTLIPGVCDLVNLHNNGVAFGFLSKLNPQLLLVVVTCVIVVAVVAALATNFISGKLGRWSAVMIAAGGIGNCIDRVINGYVQDMFKITLKPLDNFAIFNVADIFITVFCIIFIFYIIFGGEDKKTAKEDDFVDEDEDEDEEEEEPVLPVRRRVAEPVEEEVQPIRRRAAEPAEEEVQPVRRRVVEREAEEKTQETRRAVKQPTRKERQSRYEDEYAQYKAARAARAQSAEAPKSAAKPAAVDSNDPFAEWERANAMARREVENEGKPVKTYTPAAPAEKPAYKAPQVAEPTVVAKPVAKPAETEAPKAAKVSDDLDLDAILAEFK